MDPDDDPIEEHLRVQPNKVPINAAAAAASRRQAALLVEVDVPEAGAATRLAGAPGGGGRGA